MLIFHIENKDMPVIGVKVTLACFGVIKFGLLTLMPAIRLKLGEVNLKIIQFSFLFGRLCRLQFGRQLAVWFTCAGTPALPVVLNILVENHDGLN